MRRQIIPAIVSMVIFTVLLGLVYPLVITGIAQAAFKHKADGSLVEKNGKVVGSSQIAQAFVDKKGNPVPDVLPAAAVGRQLRPDLQHRLEPRPPNPKLIAKCLPGAEDRQDRQPGRRREGEPGLRDQPRRLQGLRPEHGAPAGQGLPPVQRPRRRA